MQILYISIDIMNGISLNHRIFNNRGVFFATKDQNKDTKAEGEDEFVFHAGVDKGNQLPMLR